MTPTEKSATLLLLLVAYALGKGQGWREAERFFRRGRRFDQGEWRLNPMPCWGSTYTMQDDTP